MGEARLEKVFLVLFRYSSVFSRKSSLDVGEVFALGCKVGFWFANWNMYFMQLLLSNFFLYLVYDRFEFTRIEITSYFVGNVKR